RAAGASWYAPARGGGHVTSASDSLAEEKAMKLVGIVAALVLTATAAAAQGGVERLYVLDCGVNQAKDQSRWSPGVNEGKPIEFSDNCYLIRHAKGLLLWDTGIPDAVAAMPDGLAVANGAITQRRAQTPAPPPPPIRGAPPAGPSVPTPHPHRDPRGN